MNEVEYVELSSTPITIEKTDFKKFNYWFFFLNIFWSFIIYGLITGFTIYIMIDDNSVIKANNSSSNYILSILAMSFLLIVYSFLTIMNFWSVLYDQDHFKEKIFYSIFSLNFIRLFYVVKYSYNRGLISFKWQKWKIFDIVLISVSIALLLVLKTIDMALPPVPPLYISLSFHYLGLFFISYITSSFFKTLFVGFVSGWILIVYPNTSFLNFWQYLFDYLFPMMAFSLTFFVNFKSEEKNTWLQAMQYGVFITVPFIFVLFSRIVAGVLFWSEGVAWQGVSVWVFSTVVNASNTGFDLITSLIIGPIIFSRIFFLKEKYLQQINR